MNSEFNGFKISVTGNSLTLASKQGTDNQDMTEEEKNKFTNWFENQLDLKTLYEIKKTSGDSEIRTIENCFLIKRCIDNGVGEPDMQKEKCMGYENSSGEPCEICKECKLNTCYEDDQTV